MQDALIVSGVSKKYRRPNPDRPATLQEVFLRGFSALRKEGEFWALRDVSFSVPAGKMVGLIGRNGAGKSTLLRMIGGVGAPDGGSVQLNGQVGALVDLGAGFHPELTGRENIFINAVISGLTRAETQARLKEIVEFSELADFIDNPMRTYSTGMQMRLAFSVAVHTDPDILLIDEVLAVGDIAFQRKCLQRIQQLKGQGCAIVLVSHDPGMVTQLCDEVIWLQQGRIAGRGPAEVVVREYAAEMRSETRKRMPKERPVVLTPAGRELRLDDNRFGSLEVEISAVNLLDALGLPVTEIDSGSPLTVEIHYRAPEQVPAAVIGVTISREDGAVCYDTSTDPAGILLTEVCGENRATLTLERLGLIGGNYFVDVGIYEKEWSYAYDYHWHVYPLVVRPTHGEKGILRPPHHWKIG